ncbi:hypothetical protein SCLARK_001629 [Spiroplasma clarkii]|uniref:Lipoprotein n=1 Tax=Spiroplasma clarkii TaxID=2139 RepID=A0A1Y0L299_9MOLU|nr:hypothetical protein [Spiroplasma clarkii]ARU92103.1 hypothetical protein SCLARK_001629 [Spiroplasma clarkii]ATX71441.1 hypothetical protein SCLAR_v1c11410 [Spiroplasma clarkii]
MKKLLGLLATSGLVTSGLNFVTACEQVTASAITKNTIVTAVKELQKSKNLAEVNSRLKSVKLTGLEDLTAVLKEGSLTDVVVTISLVEGYTLDEEDKTFEIKDAITNYFVDSQSLENAIKTSLTTFASFNEARNYFADLKSNFDSVKSIILNNKADDYEIVITLNNEYQFIETGIITHRFVIEIEIQSVTIRASEFRAWLEEEFEKDALTGFFGVTLMLTEILGTEPMIQSPDQFHLDKVIDWDVKVGSAAGMITLTIDFEQGYMFDGNNIFIMFNVYSPITLETDDVEIVVLEILAQEKFASIDLLQEKLNEVKSLIVGVFGFFAEAEMGTNNAKIVIDVDENYWISPDFNSFELVDILINSN